MRDIQKLHEALQPYFTQVSLELSKSIVLEVGKPRTERVLPSKKSLREFGEGVWAQIKGI